MLVTGTSSIDIGIVVYKDYYLLDKQLEHWKNYMKGDFRLVIVDNTPDGLRQKREGVIPIETDNSFDGISCGQATDAVANLCQTDIVGLCHPDFFFLDPNILEKVKEQFASGLLCVGSAGFYEDFQRIVDTDYPDQRGDIAPTCWGMFATRELAISESYVCDPPGVGKLCGWKLRKKLVDEKIPTEVIPGFFPFEDDHNICGFGDPEKPWGVHLLKGSGSRIGAMPAAYERAMEWGKSKWRS